MALRAMQLSPGGYLKELRERLQLALRDVQQASATVAAHEKNAHFYVSAARLAQIENDDSIPSVFKVFTLAVVYGVGFLDILQWYGVDPDRAHAYRAQLKLAGTHPVSSEVYNLGAKVTLPVRLDPTFKWETTQLINRVVALWGEIPAAFLINCNPRRHMYAYIGLEDYTMCPLLHPGALVMVDGERRQVARDGWKNEYERPIYLIELRDGYRCAWCQVSGSRITLIPHPISTVPVATFSLANEAEVVGQVVGVAMRLVPPAPASPEHEPALRAPS